MVDIVEIEYTDEFRKAVSKIRDSATRERLVKIIARIEANPDIGKPLAYELAGLRSLRLPPFRIIYDHKDDKITLRTFEHRKSAY
ncbi:MAG: type II toxin-antitoxin system RelE/ParE family toxin [Candidatus Aenigmarchaeota archaeon]|nr:type II toxin-antitoxin system RelE/ParE family toxin [Candidatus Aenigmarchaeota archaeon]